MYKQTIHFDMETGDPDDIYTLAILATHPKVHLLSVTIHPGGQDQLNLVKHILNILDKEHQVKVGIGKPKNQNPRVSSFWNFLGTPSEYKPDGTAEEIIEQSLYIDPYVTLVTGAALNNIINSYKKFSHKIWFKSWVCQGGFAGINIVPENLILDKFKNKVYCSTFNLGCGGENEQFFKEQSRFEIITMVGKNVCHGFNWDKSLNDQINTKKYKGLEILKQGMDIYYKKHPDGKCLHDLLAGIIAIEHNVGKYVSGWPVCKDGKWGTREDIYCNFSEMQAPFVLIDFDKELFMKVLNDE
jgi:pyrimidine-specific ribonucleoside hydrolase